ncbi:hypothetical protein [Actinoplanes sp. M2I2]|uniref:hypothetical protein n=1 Tax=Actinoplanes sp. M2I2 TaxID=1734444 RepID=UPI00201FD305|nr:hypothetical protein [Actinoplanes sp. M2I2]
MNPKVWGVAGGSVLALLSAGIIVASQNRGDVTGDKAPAVYSAVDNFDTLDKQAWRCEYSCPAIEEGEARFRLNPDVAPDKPGSWSKLVYQPARFTAARITVRFALTDRPEGRPVWWGVALWDDGPAEDGSQFNEVNFGYTTDEPFSDTQLYVESAKLGKITSMRVDTGVDLYDSEWHTATLEYDSERVSFSLDGRHLETITDRTVIPTDPMSLLLGPRLVTGGEPLTGGFKQSIDRVEITGGRVS